MTTIVKTVNKTDLEEFKFYKSDVLFNKMEKNKRKRLLEHAYKKSNEIQAQKARIIFACSEGVKKIEARITALNQSTIKLNGCTLPVKSVIGVDVV
ncbi:MAG: hypothetical protein ACPGSL_00750 [Vicingaceae bacterium]